MDSTAKNERAQRLGLTPHSRFLNIGVDNQVTWPKEEQAFDFEGYKIVLLPKTATNMPSIHIDLHGNKISHEDAQTVINRFLSIMSWCDNNFAIAQDGWSGNPVPVGVPKRNLAFTTAIAWIFDRKVPVDDKAKKALAFYRQGVNAEHNFFVSYAVLSYYKVIELRHNGKMKNWFDKNYSYIKDIGHTKDILERFDTIRGSDTPGEYLHTSCRVATAHALPNAAEPSDPDDFHEIRRLHIAADVLRLYARKFIADELKVSDCQFDGS